MMLPSHNLNRNIKFSWLFNEFCQMEMILFLLETFLIYLFLVGFIILVVYKQAQHLLISKLFSIPLEDLTQGSLELNVSTRERMLSEKAESKKYESQQEECPICMCEIEEKRVKALCSHVYCAPCMLKLIASKNSS